MTLRNGNPENDINYNYTCSHLTSLLSIQKYRYTWKNFPTCDARFFLSPKQPLCACASRSTRSEIFSKSEVASISMREQTSLAMQPMYSESVTLVANYCRNTRNICARNVWGRNMCRAVFEISGNFSKSQELSMYIMESRITRWKLEPV